MMPIYLFLRIALFIIGSFLSFHLYAEPALQSQPVSQSSDSVDLVAKEKELKEKQAALDAQAVATEAKLDAQTQAAGVVIPAEPVAAKESPVVDQPTTESVTESAKSVVTMQHDKIVEKVEALDKKLDVPALASQAVAAEQLEIIAGMKKDLEKLIERVSALEAELHPSKDERSMFAPLKHFSAVIVGFFMSWVWQPLQKVMGQSAAAK